MNDKEIAAHLAEGLRREGLTLLMPEDLSFDEVCDMIEAEGLRYPVAAWLSDTGNTAWFNLLHEGTLPAGHNATINNRKGLEAHANAVARGRLTRILQPRKEKP